jgi:C1A family cysteine protease
MKELQEKKDVGLNSYMSPEFIYDNRTNYPSEGMYCRDVMDILSNKGVCFEEIYPYASADKPASDIPQVAKDVAIKFKIKSYAMVSSVDELKTALAASGPCLIAFPCYNSSMTFWMPSKAGEALRGGHAVLIVGYTKDSFIVRNSWGTSWGDKGYTYYPFTQWGAQWECWTAVDDASPKDVPLPPPPTPHKPCGCVIA